MPKVTREGAEQAEVRWEDKPTDGNLMAAGDYLSLCGEELRELYRENFDDPIVYYVSSKPILRKAKDILRASRLPLLEFENPSVQKHLEHWLDDKAANPVLLRIRAADDPRPLEIADGYHRICASYWVGQDAEVRAFIV